MFRFRVPGNPRAGTRAKAALAQLSFSTPVTFSPEGIVPGDRLVGIMEPDGPIIVYPIHSDALVARHDSDVAWIDVRWDIAGREDRDHKVVIAMLAINRPGTLAQVSSAIAACEANIHNLSMRMGSPDFHKFIFEIEVRDLAQLTDVISTLKLTAGLSDVHRATLAEASALSNIDWSEADLEREPA
jgi:GTP diphosphokinase / guanosine-3',5'-bis(diphosphate) 3'-diphosphatase